MELIETLVVVLHVLVALALIGLVLLQQGKGAEAGASFGGGASQTVFGSQGSGSFLTKMTSILAVLFFVTSFSLAIFAKQRAAAEINTGLGQGVVSEQQAPVAESSKSTADSAAADTAGSQATVNQAGKAADAQVAPESQSAPKDAAPELE